MLLEGYASHTEILLRIGHLQLSRRTIVRRITDMSSDLVSQLKIQLIQSLAFSLDHDESTDICDVAQLCVWIRYVDSDLICHEELLSLEGIHDRTRGEDVAALLINICLKLTLKLIS